MMTIARHRPYYRGSSCICIDCGLFLFDVRTGARLRALNNVDPIKLAAVELRFSHDPELAQRLVDEDIRKVVSTYKLADKFNDFLMNPKARPDLQTPEAQEFLSRLKNYHNPKTDALMPWLTREWKKGRIKPHPNNPATITYDGGPEYGYPHPTETGKEATHHALTPDELDHWGDWYQSNHPSRRGKDIMQLKAPELHQTIKDWDTDMREQAGGAAQKRGDIVHSYPDGWSVQRLSGPQLKDEGEKMGHCVGSYAPDVEQGRSLIYSLRDHQNEPHATWEITPHLWEGSDGQIYDGMESNGIPADAEPIIHKGTMEQVQGKGNEPPIEAYQKRIKDYFEKQIPNAGERPKWDSQHHDDIDEYMDEEGQNGYIAYHPGEYGLEKPKITYDWPELAQGAIGWNTHDPYDVTKKVAEDGQLEPFASATKQIMGDERRTREEELHDEWDKWNQDDFNMNFREYDPEPDYESYGENQGKYNSEWEAWEQRERKAEEQARNEYIQGSNQAWDLGTRMDEFESAIASQKLQAKRAKEDSQAGISVKTSSSRPPHRHFTTGEPCYCTFRKFTPEPRIAKTRSLYHGTLLDNVPGIEAEGLQPQRGDFVSDAYDEYYKNFTPEEIERELPPTTHATDGKELIRALNAIRWHVGNKLGKNFKDVTRDDVINHGALIKHPGKEGMPTNPQDADHRWNYRPDDEGWMEKDYPGSVEPEDYYTNQPIPPHELVPITGPAMMRVFDRANLRFETPEGRPNTPGGRQAKLPVCEVCGDPLDHGQCQRCDWGQWSNAMGDGDQNPTDPTREFHPSIQASNQD